MLQCNFVLLMVLVVTRGMYTLTFGAEHWMLEYANALAGETLAILAPVRPVLVVTTLFVLCKWLLTWLTSQAGSQLACAPEPIRSCLTGTGRLNNRVLAPAGA